MYSFERLKETIERRKKVRFRLLKKEVRQVRAFIEKTLTFILESTASKARTDYSGLEMY